MKLAKKADCNRTYAEIEQKILDQDHNNKYITTPEFNKLTAENFTARWKEAKLLTEPDILKKADFDEKLKKINKKSYFK